MSLLLALYTVIIASQTPASEIATQAEFHKACEAITANPDLAEDIRVSHPDAAIWLVGAFGNDKLHPWIKSELHRIGAAAAVPVLLEKLEQGKRGDYYENMYWLANAVKALRLLAPNDENVFQAINSATVVSDPFEAMREPSRSSRDSNRWRYRADFNNDELMDVALSQTTMEMGNAGGAWFLFLQEPDGAFRYVDSFGAGYSVQLTPIKPGLSELLVYGRHHAREGTMGQYNVSSEGVELVHSEVVTFDDEGNLHGVVFTEWFTNPLLSEFSTHTSDGAVSWTSTNNR